MRVRRARTTSSWHRVAGALPALSLACAAALPAQGASTPTEGAVAIRIVVDSSGRAEVSEQLSAVGDTATMHSSFQLLARPCAAVGDVSVSAAARTSTLRRTAGTPWQLLDDSSGIIASNPDATLRYYVTLSSGGHDIPLVVPTYPVARGADGRSSGISLHVVLPRANARVTFPRLQRVGASGEWQGDFIAVPSFVSVRLGQQDASCRDALPPSSDGGLSWRFWLLVAILVVWVPTYQWWARRQPEESR